MTDGCSKQVVSLGPYLVHRHCSPATPLRVSCLTLMVLSNRLVTIYPDQSRHLPHYFRSRTEAVVDRGRT